MVQTSAKKLVFLASGEGQLFESTANKLIKEGFQVVGLLTQNPQAGCVKRAEKLQVPVFLLSPGKGQIEESLKSTLEKLKPDAIVLAGFTRKIPEDVVASFESRIVNSHPSLLPKFGGKGMYGRFVHEAVLKAGEKMTGISVHIVSQHYDEGPLIAQKQISIPIGTSVEALENLVKETERDFFPEALKKWLLSL